MRGKVDDFSSPVTFPGGTGQDPWSLCDEAVVSSGVTTNDLRVRLETMPGQNVTGLSWTSFKSFTCPTAISQLGQSLGPSRMGVVRLSLQGASGMPLQIDSAMPTGFVTASPRLL